MSQNLPLYIGLRYLRSHRNNGFLTFVSLFALIGMILGVFALIVVLSVMNGFNRELTGRILKVVPHAYVSEKGGMSHWQDLSDTLNVQPFVVGSSPYIHAEGLASHNGYVRGVQIQGVAPSIEKTVSRIDDAIQAGDFTHLVAGEYRVILGSLLARYLGVDVGDKLEISLPELSITPAGAFPRSKRFTVAGVFEVGAQQDEFLMLIHLQDAQKLLRRGNKVDGLRIQYTDIFQAEQNNATLAKLPQFSDTSKSFTFVNWVESQGNLFHAVKMEKTVVGVMLSIIIAVAAFNIITSLVMMVSEKRSDIAVLRTMGLSRTKLVLTFVTQGSLLGIFGVLIGGASGIATAVSLESIMKFFEAQFGLYVFDPNIYFVTHLPSVWQLEDTLIVAAVALFLSITAAIYPALRAAKISPAEALRYDT